MMPADGCAWTMAAAVRNDHHTAYLARAVAALTPQGHVSVDELLEDERS
jgi:hypothetical protein